MIIKLFESIDPPGDSRLRAGREAERQLAFYLHRAFNAQSDTLVLNGLRLVDIDQPGPDGRSGVCQIDHLVLNRFGAFIVESKSVFDEVSVRDDGAGGDEWTRRYKGRDQGFASPIQQARRQGDFLRSYLHRHREALLGKVAKGSRTLAKLVAGTDQRGFAFMPIQIVVAISDGGKIRRVGGWQPPSEPFRTFVSKADLVPDKIRGEHEKHRAARGLLSKADGDYGVWQITQDELEGVAAFLNEHHRPRETTPEPPAPSLTPAPADTHTDPKCKACGGADLTAMSGRYGYYWKCAACAVNTAMPLVCSVCGADGRRGQDVKIRKSGPKYYRACGACEIEECVWTE